MLLLFFQGNAGPAPPAPTLDNRDVTGAISRNATVTGATTRNATVGGNASNNPTVTGRPPNE